MKCLGGFGFYFFVILIYGDVIKWIVVKKKNYSEIFEFDNWINELGKLYCIYKSENVCINLRNFKNFC